MKSTLSIAVVALLYGAEAVQFRPYINGRTPWYKTAKRPDPTPFPHDYAVPNFGADTDMAGTAKHIAAAEKKYKIKYDPKRKHGPPGPAAVDYKVPSFGVDSDIAVTQRNIADTEKELGKKMKATFAQPAPPASYTVPNFGQDTDVKGTLNSIKLAESRYKIKYDPERKHGPPAAAAVDYKVPNFGVDSDIIATGNSLKQAEAQAAAKKKPATKGKAAKPVSKLSQIEEQNMALSLAASQAQPNTYDELAQIEVADDPICGSGGCTQYKHKKAPLGYPIDYPVPSFGADPEIEANHKSLSIAEAMHSHKLIMGTPESKAKWHNVAKDTMYDFAPALDKDIADTQSHIPLAEGIRQHKWNIGFAQTGADIRLESDPICGSGGCQFEHAKAALGYPVDYPVPSFGEDPEIAANHKSLSIAEAMHNHKLVMGTPESKAKWHNVAKDTMYDFAPALDSDIADTVSHIPVAEGIVKHKWTIA